MISLGTIRRTYRSRMRRLDSAKGICRRLTLLDKMPINLLKWSGPLPGERLSLGGEKPEAGPRATLAGCSLTV